MQFRRVKGRLSPAFVINELEKYGFTADTVLRGKGYIGIKNIRKITMHFRCTVNGTNNLNDNDYSTCLMVIQNYMKDHKIEMVIWDDRTKREYICKNI